MKEYKYFAFISYNSKDAAWGKRLQRKLEHYRMPSTVCKERGWNRIPIKPVFYAPTDIQPGALEEELKERLRNSKHLIVICSPNSARAPWVGKEIEYFHQLGRDENVHFFIINGIPNSGDPETECFNPIIKELGLPEILGANIHEKVSPWPWINRQRAYVQLISKLLNVEFDSIWQRHRRQFIAKISLWGIGITAVLAAMFLIWANSRPFDATVLLEEASIHNPNLPPLGDAIISLRLDTETKTDTIRNAGATADFRNIPSKYLGKDVRFTFSCQDFLPLDTIVTLAKSVILRISRNPEVYGNIRTELWDFKHDCPVANTMVKIEQWETQSDTAGVVTMSVPLKFQKPTYIIQIPAYNTTDSISMPSNDYHSIGINI